MALGVFGVALHGPVHAQTSQLPITPEWRETAQRVAQAGVPLADLAPNAPDSHTVKPGDTLWGISSLFLKSAWRWPELWGMNLEQIRNPHLIYPGQVLVLEKKDGRATLRMATGTPGTAPTNTVRMSPRSRASPIDTGAIASVVLHLIGPFFNEAQIFETNQLDTAPRVVATQENRVMVSRGETTYVRGDLAGAHDFRLFRPLTPLIDPDTREVLGYEGRYVGTAELREVGNETAAPVVPATFTVTSARLESSVGDRLSPVPPQELVAYVPHRPAAPMSGRIVSIYGDGLKAGQNHVVAINRGARDGVERGHVLALWRSGSDAIDRTQGSPVGMRLPDEKHGLLFVFRVFDRVSYALILRVREPVSPGDRFTQP